jgi:3',5'-cyclic AMP phosphodiesterase CpdA
MRLHKLFTLFLSVILLSGTVSAQNKRSARPFFFIQITDPQFGFLDENKSFKRETELYQKAVDEVNRLNPDFVVITGDLVNNGTDSLQWAEFKSITSNIKPSVPVYYSPGNHDIGQTPTKQSISHYIASFGDDKFSFKHKKNWFIGFNSCVIKADAPEMEEEQFVWLKKELKNAKKAKHVILFCHHPLFIKDPDEPETYSNISIEKRKKYLELFEGKNVNALFAGHYHDNAYGKYNRLSMITSGAVGKPLGKAFSGLRIVVVSKSGVASAYYSLDNIPETVDFEIKDHK